MSSLKLLALDQEDLSVISTHLQDAIVRSEDLIYLNSDQRFLVIANRFDWEHALEQDKSSKSEYRRCRSVVRFDRILGVQSQNIAPAAEDIILELLAIEFEASDPPGGYLTLQFSGKSVIRLQVECIEVELLDLGAVWKTRNKPDHQEESDLAE